jgi:L-2-hydroxyglutarate oxidase
MADVAIIGGGILGLATAYHLTQRDLRNRVIVLEKEPELASHQSGHNSGVLHSGIYYRPGSRKATHCREGKRLLEAFCEVEGIPFERCGKVIVAVEERELPVLEQILERGRANGVRCERIGRQRLRELEPHAVGLEAIHVPETGIVDFRQVSERLAARVREAGGTVLTGARVTALREQGRGVRLYTTAGEIESQWVVGCCGLHSDRVARLAGARPGIRIVPFRGEYYELDRSARDLCLGLVYPVPDPEFPFLGVHVTRTIRGPIECGPNAVLALAREGYRKLRVSPRDLAEIVAYRGFWRLVARHGKRGASSSWGAR